MKYYVYVSKTKIEMLHAQIDLSSLDYLKATFQVDYGLGHVGIELSKRAPENDIRKLQEVLNEVWNKKDVGSLTQDKPFIRGTLEMCQLSIENQPVSLWTYKEGYVAMALTGSTSNLIAHRKPIGRLAKLVLKFESQAAGFDHVVNDIVENAFTTGEIIKNDNTTTDISDAVMLAVDHVTDSKSRFEFVAKVLYRRTYKEAVRGGVTKVVLATPLYVAQIDNTYRA